MDVARIKALRMREMRENVARDILAAAFRTRAGSGHARILLSFDPRQPGIEWPRSVPCPESVVAIEIHRLYSDPVLDAALRITLFFDGVTARIRIPFQAMTGIALPDSGFLQEMPLPGGHRDLQRTAPCDAAPTSGTVIDLGTRRRQLA